MKVINTPFEGLFVISPEIFEDERGYFFEAYNKKRFEKSGLYYDFVQDNQSLSAKNVLRGLHFQNPPHGQAKLVQVLSGKVLDVVVDIRKKSKTFGESYCIELSEKNKKMLLMPEGFAHGFLSLEDNTLFSYKCNSYYNKASEDSIKWNDPDLNINWGVDQPVVSEKDEEASLFKDFHSQF